MPDDVMVCPYPSRADLEAAAAEPFATIPLELRCPACGSQPGARCVTASGRPTRFHKARPGCPGFAGRDERGRQFCLKCKRWKFVAIHSCPGVPQ